MLEIEPVSGIRWTSKSRFNTTGDVLLGMGMGSFDWKRVDDMFRSAICVSLVGKFSFGLSRVIDGGVGRGGVRTSIFGR